MPDAYNDAQDVFADLIPDVYPWQWEATILVERLVGGVPSDENVIRSWIATKLGAGSDERIEALVAETMVDRGITREQAAEEVSGSTHRKGFKRDDVGLFIEGRQAKACIREATNIARAAGNLPSRYGATRKGPEGFVREHLFVPETKLHLRRAGRPLTEPDGTMQRFLHVQTPMGPRNSIQYEDHVDSVELHFTLITDYDFARSELAAILLTAGQNGIGASRSQGFGCFKTVGFEQVRGQGARPKADAHPAAKAPKPKAEPKIKVAA